jgi:hypothetical protein
VFEVPVAGHWPASNEALALPFTVFEGPSVLAGISAGQPVAAATAVIINDWFHNVAMQHDSVICEGMRKKKT